MMTPFTIFPAIDLRNGQVVRLQVGDPARQTTFGSDPELTGRRWVAAGAGWLHVVNLDGAFDEKGAANWAALPRLTRLGVQVQFGGGMRTADDIARAFDAGATRVILGTVAVEAPDLVAAAVARHGAERIVVGIDARDGWVRSHGWQTATPLTPVALGRKMATLGIQTVIHTDISRDGVLAGVNGAASAALAAETGLEVIASGGVATLADIRALLPLRAAGVGGVVVGRALYDEKFTLADALALAAQE
jgi:phosphoribosylformimino-5-aminoimidazole carboxamide ribotide isomerase